MSGAHEDFRAVLEPKSSIQEGSPGCLLRGTADFAVTNVTERDPMGPSRDRPFPHLLCFSSSLKHPGNSIWCFTDVKTPHKGEDVNYLMTLST